MKLCRHRWHVHNKGKESWQWDFCTNGGIFLVTIFNFCGHFFGVGCSLEGLGYPKFAPIIALCLSVVALAITVRNVVNHLENSSDPWAAEDKTCVKCHKIVFDATKQAERLEKKKKKEKDGETPPPLISHLNEQYAKAHSMRKKAGA